MVTTDPPHDEQRRGDQAEAAQALVGEQLRTARAEVFRAYLRARERARTWWRRNITKPDGTARLPFKRARTRTLVRQMSSTSAASEADSLAFAGLRRQASLIASGEVSSVELVDAALRRIDAAQPDLNAFRIVCAESARAQAVEADRRHADGEAAPLLGVPVAIKDDMDLAGETTAFGCCGEFTGKETDGEVARRLREAGAVIVGKTTSPEFGQYPITEGEAFGQTRNPWSLDHTPGGSSGGSAAAVAAAWWPPRSALTAPARSASPPRGRISSASSPSAGASRLA